MRWKLMTVCAATLLVGGCSMTTGIVGTDACAVWRPISWSQKDTPETIEGVKINNARRLGYCGR